MRLEMVIFNHVEGSNRCFNIRLFPSSPETAIPEPKDTNNFIANETDKY